MRIALAVLYVAFLTLGVVMHFRKAHVHTHYRPVHWSNPYGMLGEWAMYMSLSTFTLGVRTFDPFRVMVPYWALWAGYAATAVGLTLISWSRWTLGRQWVGAVGHINGHRLIVTGPYKFVRNPMYEGHALLGIGVPLLAGSPILLLLGVVMSATYLARIPAEEQMMQELFGWRYDAYRYRTGRFLPRLRR